MPRDAKSKCICCSKFLSRPDISRHRLAVIDVEFAEGIEVLHPFINKIRRYECDNWPTGTIHCNGVGCRQGNEGFSHPYFVGKNHSGLVPEPAEDFLHFHALSGLVHLRDAVFHARAEHQLRRRIVDVAHALHRLTTLSQKCSKSTEVALRLACTCGSIVSSRSRRKAL